MKFPKLAGVFMWATPYIKVMRNYPNIELAAAWIGIVALLILVILLLIPIPVSRPDLSISTPLTAGSPEFMSALSGLTHASIQMGTPVQLLNNGDEVKPAFIESIQKAKSTINITNFIWHKGTFSDAMFDALTDAENRGVAVRVLIDAEETTLNKEKLEAFQKAGGKFEKFRKPSLTTLLRVNKRTHRRAIIIDGHEGYLGGVAIDDAWLGDGRTKGHWRDLMFRVEGPMAVNLQSAFADEWYETTGEVIAGDNFYPKLVNNGTIPYVHIATSPTEYSMPIEQLYMLSVLSAHKNIYIENPYFLPSKEMVKALIDAARSGIDVRVLVPASTFSPVHHAVEINYTKLLEAGVLIYEYKTLMHTKSLSIDGIWAVIGSANLDNRSRAINNENVMGLVDPVLAKQLEDTFMSDTTFADEITLSEWKKHSFIQGIIAHLSFLFQKQY